MDIQQLFKFLKKEAECPLCLETMKNPKTLACLHSFCLECLDELANFARRQPQTTIKCPVCQSSLPIPETYTFANLPSSFHLNRLVDVLALEDSSVQAQKCNTCEENNMATSYCFICQSFMCSSCFQYHQRFKPTRGHRNVLIDKLQTQDVQELMQGPVMCSQQYHEDQPLEFYCEDCKVLVCHKCSVVSHNRHSMTDTQKAAQEQKTQIMEAVAKVKGEILLYENEIKKQTELKNKNITDTMNAEKKMTETVEELISDLREHEKKMKDKFRKIHEAEQKQHATRLEKLDLISTRLKSFVERGQEILERNMSAEILQTNPAIIGRCNELLNARKPDVYKSPYLNYLVDKKFDPLGQILVTKTDPSMCLTEGHDSLIGKESEFVVVTRDSEGLQWYQEDDQIEVDILTPEGDHLKSELKDNKDSKYTVTYTPQCSGQHRVEVQVNGQPLTSNSFVVHDHHQYQFALKFGSSRARAGKFSCIFDIAVSDKTGTIAVADVGNRRIYLFSSGGKFQRDIELTRDDWFISVVFTDCGDLLTLSSGGNCKFCVFNEEGRFIKRINNMHLKTPLHLSVTKDGRLIITDGANNEVKVLSPDGNDLLLSFTAQDCTAHPQYAVYHLDKFFVSYPGAHCVKVFDKRGAYLHDIGCKGSNDGQLSYPLGLVIDNYNQLIVCDENNRSLQIYTLSGKFLSKLQGGYLNNNSPRFAAISNNGKRLYVASSCSIYVFH